MLCRAELTADTGGAERTVTDNLCVECRSQFSSPSELLPLEQYLNRLDVPVLVMDDDVRVLSFNEAARALLGKNPPEIRGHYAGEVMECAYAALPGGCGRTEHCKACAIRRAVTNTHVTGASHVRETTCRSVHTSCGIRETRSRISTEKVGPFVLLRIDELNAS